MPNQKPNITPEDVGKLYDDSSGNIWRCDVCNAEPLVVMRRILDQGEVVEPNEAENISQPFSYFKKYVRLLPDTRLSHRKKDIPKKQTSEMTNNG